MNAPQNALPVLILGNSHLAALKSAHDQAPGRWPGLAPVFFGAGSQHIARLALRAGALQAETPDDIQAFRHISGRASVDLAPFAAVVVAGCGLSAFRSIGLYRRYLCADLPSARGQGAARRKQMLSRAVFLESLAGLFADSLALRLGQRLWQAQGPGTDLPAAIPRLIFTAQPAPAETLALQPRAYAGFLRAARAGDAQALAQLQAQALALAFATLFETAAPGLQRPRFIAQPAASLASPLTTAQAYSAGSTRLAARPGLAHPPEDVLHGNAAYGALVLDQLAAVLGGADQGPDQGPDFSPGSGPGTGSGGVSPRL